AGLPPCVADYPCNACNRCSRVAHFIRRAAKVCGVAIARHDATGKTSAGFAAASAGNQPRQPAGFLSWHTDNFFPNATAIARSRSSAGPSMFYPRGGPARGVMSGGSWRWSTASTTAVGWRTLFGAEDEPVTGRGQSHAARGVEMDEGRFLKLGRRV